MILLLQVALLDDGAALAAWQEWKSTSTLDAASWAEVRLLAASSKRIQALDPAYELHGRLQGFRRYVFTHTHRTLNGTRPMMQALHQAGIEMMLLKGGIRLATDPSLAAERFVSDIDVLIRVGDWDRAMAVAREQGWTVPGKPLPMSDGTFEGMFAFAHSLDFESSKVVPGGHLDVHHHARHMCRNPGDDDAAWEQASAGEFLGVPVLIPSPTHHLLVTLTHAFRYQRVYASLDWAIDLARILQAGGVDWNRLEAETEASHTQAFVAGALLFLREKCRLAVPAESIMRIADQVDRAQIGELHYLHNCHYRSPALPALAMAARDAATKRARLALRRLPPPPSRKGLALPALKAPSDPAPGYRLIVPLPNDLRPSDNLTLDMRFTVVKAAASSHLTVTSPMMLLYFWKAPRVRERGKPRAVRLATRLPSPLLVAGRCRVFEVRLHSGLRVTDFRIAWRREPLLKRIRRRLGRIKARAFHLLGKPGAES